MSKSVTSPSYATALAALPARRRQFVEAYLDTLNASEAARQSKYAKPGEEGYRLLKNAQVAEAIRLGLAEKALGREEVLSRLAAHATASLEDFIRLPAEVADPESDEAKKTHIWQLDLVKAKRLGKMSLIKKLRWGEFGPEIELYDAQAALTTLARHHGLLVDRQEVTGPAGGPVKITEVVVMRPQESGEETT